MLSCLSAAGESRPSIKACKGLDPTRIEEPHSVWHDQQHLAARELGDRAAYRFEREPEIIGNVLPRHRKGDGYEAPAQSSPALAQANQKGRYAFLRRAAAEQQHVVLREAQLVRRRL